MAASDLPFRNEHCQIDGAVAAGAFLPFALSLEQGFLSRRDYDCERRSRGEGLAFRELVNSCHP